MLGNFIPKVVDYGMHGLPRASLEACMACIESALVKGGGRAVMSTAEQGDES